MKATTKVKLTRTSKVCKNFMKEEEQSRNTNRTFHIAAYLRMKTQFVKV